MIDTSPNAATQVLQKARAGRPRWLSLARKNTPSWFSGQELDLLDADERDRLYRDVAARIQTNRANVIILVLVSGTGIVRGAQSGATRALWLAVAAGYVMIVAGAWLYRKKRIRDMARREVREAADWPLRSQARSSDATRAP